MSISMLQTKILLIILGLLLIAAVYLFTLGFISKSKTVIIQSHKYLSEQLVHCPEKPNCVCSEDAFDTEHYIEPIVLSVENANQSLEKVIAVLQQMGGSILSKNETYIAATFTSDIFGFVDDFEIRIDAQKQRLHLRSASRVGKSDLGANRNRVNLFKKHFANLADVKQESNVS